ncbi:MAG: restriction endonuclease subunit S [Campylobacteraceae bacterium]|nr:restriction endonuclease subunit S [Campylobacteraceae bacterium]
MSEVMNVPDGWKNAILKDILSNKTKKAEATREIPIIDLENIEQGTGKLVLNSWANDFPKDKIQFTCGNILFGKLRPYLQKFWFANFNGASTSELLVLEAKKNIDEKFIFYVIHMSRFLSYADRFSYGTKMPRVSFKDLQSYKLILPKEKIEQQKIAKILSTLDKTIEATQKLIDKEKNIKKGLMHDLLTNGIDQNGKIRTPQTHTYKQSELGLIPAEWGITNLKKCIVGNGQYGVNAPAVDYSYSLPTYLRITDIDESGHFIEHDKKSVITDDIENYTLEEGDIVFARTGNTTGKTYLYNPKDGKLVFAGFLIKFHPNPKKLVVGYLKAITETSRYWSWVQTYSARTGQPGINANEYASIKLTLPLIEEQKEISKILTTQDKKIQTEETNLAKLKELKKGLMNDLLSGKERANI